MKIIKFKNKKKYKYKRKVSIKNLILKISVGLHDFEKKKKLEFEKTEIKGLHTPSNFDVSNGINVWD